MQTQNFDRRSFFMLSGEGQSIQLGELKALLETYGTDASLEQVSGRVLVGRGVSHLEDILRRAAYLRLGGYLVGEIDTSSLTGGFEALHYYPFLKDARSFAARVFDFTSGRLGENAEPALGRSIKKIVPHLKVSLDSPDVILTAIICPERTLVGVIRPDAVRKTWSHRRPRARPFFHPSTLYPKFARALVNLARIKAGQTFLDPFCGAGGILLEASLMGMNVVGFDINRRMCQGAFSNLSKLGSEFLGIVNGDAKTPCISRCEGIATDLPYGRAASTVGVNTQQILNDFINEAELILQKGRHLVFVSPEGVEVEDASGFRLVDKHRLYVHRNLTRVITVLRRS